MPLHQVRILISNSFGELEQYICISD